MALFTPLPATTEGVGPYRINRYRVYFRPLTEQQRLSGFKHNRTPSQIALDLAKQYKANFPSFFNPNSATVYSRGEKYNGRNTLRFILNASLFGMENEPAKVLTPDLHADWVGVEHDHPRGFTVQTLKRNFTTGLDWAMAGATFGGATATGAAVGAGYTWWTGAGALAGAGTGALIGAGAGTIAGITGFNLNKHHFLAGRRSWVFGTKADFGRHGVQNYDEIPNDALVFETAACERLSGHLFRVITASRLLGHFDRAIHKVWCKLMNNFFDVTGFEKIDAKVWGHQEGYVSFTEPAPYATLQHCRASGELGDMSRNHVNMLA